MSVATYTPTSVFEVLSSIVDFLSGDGWTIVRNSSYVFTYSSSFTPTSGVWACLERDGYYVNFYAFEPKCMPVSGSWTISASYIGVSIATGYDASLAWDLQPGACRESNGEGRIVGMYAGTGGTLNLYSWSGSPQVAMTLEISSGTFLWLAFGTLEMFGVVSGGEFMTASYAYSGYRPGPFVQAYEGASGWNGTMVRSDLNGGYDLGWFFPVTGDGADRRCRLPIGNYLNYPIYNNNYYNSGYAQAYNVTLNGLLAATPNNFIGASPMLPLPIYVESGTATDRWMPLGIVPNIRYVDMTYLSAGEEVEMGDDVWVCWPIYTMTSNDRRGLAVLKEI